MEHDDKIQTCIIDILSHKDFKGLRGLNDLVEKLVMILKSKVHPLGYRLVILSFIIPVAIATIKRVFSAMKIINNS